MKRRSILICEGETDQVLLSYYFKEQFGYNYIGKSDNLLYTTSREESVCLYEREKDHDELTIWAVGSHSLLKSGFHTVLSMNKSNADKIYSRIVIITDRDSEPENNQLWKDINQQMRCFGIDATLCEGEWGKVQQSVGFEEEIELEILGLSIPLNEEGALETFLLNALEEQENNRYLVQQSKNFVNELRNNMDLLNGYLSTRRLCVKAPLSVFFAITNPEKAYQPFKNIILSVTWEKYRVVQKSFDLLNNFKNVTP